MFKTRILALSACALLSVGCSGIGDGSKLETIRIVQSPTQPNVVAADLDAYTCVRSSLTLIGEFTRGDLGNFSSRATWSSSDDTVLKVSSFNKPVGDGSDDVYLIGGVLLPQAASATPVTISADYLGLHAEVQVTVSEATNVRFVPASAKIVPNSFVQYAVRATLGGVETDISALTTISFVTENDAVAVLDSSSIGVVRGVAANTTPMQLKADPGVPCEGLTAEATIAEPDATDPLQLDYEKGFDTGAVVGGIKTGQLAEGTSQFLRLYARFQPKLPEGEVEDFSDPNQFQDLSNQMGAAFSYDVDGDGTCEVREEGAAPTGATAPVLFNNGLLGIISGLSLTTAAIDDNAVGETTLICADFGGTSATEDVAAENGVLSNPLSFTVVDAPLESLALSASDPCDPTVGLCVPLDAQRDLSVPRVFGGDLLRIDALGTFVGGYTQNVNKNVSFSSSLPLLASVVTGVSRNAGVVVTASDLDSVEECVGQDVCNATITVTWTGNATDTLDDRTAEIVVQIQRAADDELPAAE